MKSVLTSAVLFFIFNFPLYFLVLLHSFDSLNNKAILQQEKVSGWNLCSSLKQYIKYSHQSLFRIIFIYYSSFSFICDHLQKYFFTTGTSHHATGSSVKSIWGVTISKYVIWFVSFCFSFFSTVARFHVVSCIC